MKVAKFAWVVAWCALSATACGSSKSVDPLPNHSTPAIKSEPAVGLPTHLEVSDAGDIVVGKPFPIQVQYMDANNNLVNDANIVATVSLGADANLTGILSQHLAGGQALFTSLFIGTPGTYTVHITAGQFSTDLPAFSAKSPTWALDSRDIDRQIIEQGADGNTVLAVDSQGLSYISHDRGQTWQGLVAGQSLCLSFGCIDPHGHLDTTDSNIIYFPTTISRDGGNTFFVTSYARLAQDGLGTLYGIPTNTGHPLVRSTDHGLSWSTVEDFLNRTPSSVGIDPNTNAIVVCFSETATCATSRNGGATWSEGTTTGAYNPIWAVYVDPARSGVLYGKTENPAGLWRSADLGATWQSVAQPTITSNGDAFSLVVSPSPASRLYLVGRNSNGNNPYSTASAVLSDDGGQTWKRIGFGLPAGCIGLAADLTDPQILYADCPIDTNGTFRLFVTRTAGQ